MHVARLARIRQCLALAIAAFAALFQATAASAIVRVDLSFLSPTDLRQGEIGAIGVYDFGAGPQAARSQACCFPVSAAPAGGPPFVRRRSFVDAVSISQIVFLGVSTVSGQDHLVLALNTPFSTTLVGTEFSVAFAGFSETTIIADLFGQFDQTLTPQQRGEARDRLGVFEQQLFAQNAGFGVADAFSLTSFSIGTQAGSGFSTLIVPPAIPEPAAWALAILGFAVAGATLRHGRPRTASAT